jgi:Gas vesicle synthesis protein GvpL/GvpF
MQVSGLACFYSEHSTLAAGNTRERALEFHQIVKHLFELGEIIPFRFPTLLADRAEIASEIEKHSPEYKEGFAKIRGRVQIEIRIRPRVPEKEAIVRNAASAGTGYLQARYDRYLQLRSAADALRAAAGEFIENWREREYSDHLRCFGLIARDSYGAVQPGMARASLPSHIEARVSGPWPPTEFLKEE